MSEIQETAICRYRDESEWIIDTSDLTVINLLTRRGWKSVSKDGKYYRFVIPRKAITVRSAKGVKIAAGRMRNSGADAVFDTENQL